MFWATEARGRTCQSNPTNVVGSILEHVCVQGGRAVTEPWGAWGGYFNETSSTRKCVGSDGFVATRKTSRTVLPLNAGMLNASCE